MLEEARGGMPKLRTALPVLILAGTLSLLSACRPLAPVSSPAPTAPEPPPVKASTALRPVPEGELPFLLDDGDRAGLKVAAQRSLSWLSRRGPEDTFTFGPREVSAKSLVRGVRLFLSWLDQGMSREQLAAEVMRHFEVLESVGGSEGGMLVTGYFLPEIAASLQRSAEYAVPIYGPPPGLIRVDLGEFGERFAGVKLVGRLRQGRLVPFPERKEIRESGVLAGREIAWAKDPVDLFFLEIQGSGTLLLPDGGRQRIGYAGSNGRPYRSIGKLLIDQGKIEREKVSMQSIRAYLDAHPEEVRQVLDHNASTVFFRRLEGEPVGSLGVAVTAERSIATDLRLFPRGSLAFLVSEVPDLDAEGRTVAVAPLHRFVFNQDTGGAIRGPGRVDYFWGGGELAARRAGAMKQPGRLFFLVPKG